MQGTLQTLDAICRAESRRLRIPLAQVISQSIFFVVLIGLALALRVYFPGMQRIGVLLHMVYVMFSMGLMIFVIGQVTSEAVGDVKSGFLSLVYLTNLTSFEWTCVRVFELWRSFLLIWISRLPVLFWMSSQGGLRWHYMWVTELFLLGLFAMLSSITLAASNRFEHGQVAYSFTLGMYVIYESLANAPKTFHWLSLGGTAMVEEWDWPVEFSLIQHLNHYLSGLVSQPEVGLILLVQIVVAVLFLWGFQRSVYRNVVDGDLPATFALQAAWNQSRTRPRCDIQPLEWQAYYYYSAGRSALAWRIGCYSTGLLLLCLMMYFKADLNYFRAGLLALAAWSIHLVTRLAIFLTVEIRRGTIPLLILVFHDGPTIYRHWERAIWWVGIVDVIFLPILLTLLWTVIPHSTWVIAATVGAVLTCGPLALLLPLISISFAGIRSVIGHLSVVLLIVAVSMIVAKFTVEVVFPFLTCLLLWLFNRWVLRTTIRKWFDHGLEFGWDA